MRFIAMTSGELTSRIKFFGEPSLAVKPTEKIRIFVGTNVQIIMMSMNWKQFKLVNNLLGWLVAGIAAVVYLMTIEPTASLWDCAEFVACDYRLEAGHPPGAPFYMLIYNVISHLAPSAAEAGLYANATSAILSALGILFLFWTLTHLMRRLVLWDFRGDNTATLEGKITLSPAQSLVVFGSALVGSLVYTFSDTYWFSAVEAEVYAFSSLFTAVVFWLMFQWEERADQEGSDRWLILIAYLMGLSIGVHLLNLLCLPAMALVYYYRRSKYPLFWEAVGSILISFGLIVVMMYGIVQGVPKMSGRFDWFFVNDLGFGFNSGLYAYLVLIFSLLSWSVYEAHQGCKRGSTNGRMLIASLSSIILLGIPFLGDGYLLGTILSIGLIVAAAYWGRRLSPRLLHTAQLSLLAIVIGFSSYGVILVRAMADTPMNENAPSNPFALRYYLAREQYGSAPLLYGANFTSKPISVKYNKELFGKAPKTTESEQDRYTKLGEQPEYEYSKEDKTLFPRMHSRQHAPYYNSWIGRDESDMSTPTFGDNLTYFFAYQLNYMYWRYFMWNFVGRQDDIQGQGDLLHGNAITGIDFIDSLLVGDQSTLPDSLKNNKGRNVYYALPLLLGLLGMFYQVSRTRIIQHVSDEEQKKLQAKHKKEATPIGHQSFWIVFMLFVMTGIAIVVYLNQTPGQPRERDYAFAGSFYAFAVWVGMGVAGLTYLLKKFKLSELSAAAMATIIGLGISLQMAGQSWDDHDRSGRTIARDAGLNYLESVEPNAILFCFGDNDTFPLWYMQDVEGVRRDVRTMNLSYLGGDWYIDQMRRKTYTGEAVPLKHMTPDLYYYHEAAYIAQNETEQSLADVWLELLRQKEQKAKELVIPTQRISLPVKDKAKLSARLSSDLSGRVLDTLPISLQGKRYLDRGGLTLLDLLAKNNWERPIYWTSTSPRDALSNLPQHMVQTGMAYQLLPVHLGAMSKGEGASTDSLAPHHGVRTEIMYDNVMRKFRWGGADKPNVYMDEAARNMLQGMRNNVFVPLAKALLQEGDTTRAKEVLTRCLEVIRPENVPYEQHSLRLVDALYAAGMHQEAGSINKEIVGNAMETLGWILRQNDKHLERLLLSGEAHRQYQTVMLGMGIASQYKSENLKLYEPVLEQYLKLFGR